RARIHDSRDAHAAVLSFPTRRSSDLCPPKRWSHMHRRPHLALVVSLLVVTALTIVASEPVAAQGNEGQAADGAQLFASTCAGCQDRKSTRLNSSHVKISYAVFCLKKK